MIFIFIVIRGKLETVCTVLERGRFVELYVGTGGVGS
jgi:hypothetical protein